MQIVAKKTIAQVKTKTLAQLQTIIEDQTTERDKAVEIARKAETVAREAQEEINQATALRTALQEV